MLFGQERMYAFAQLGGALAGLAFVRMAPRRGISFLLSESLYGMRNRYYRWKRRRAARKFEVYMRKQGRTVKFDGQGRRIDEDAKTKSDGTEEGRQQRRDPNARSRECREVRRRVSRTAR